MKKILLLILVTLGYANYTAAIAGRYNPPSATFPTTITGPVASGGAVTSSPIAIAVTLNRTASRALLLSDFTVTNGTLSGLTEKVVLNYSTQFGTAGTGNGNFAKPNDLTLDAAGNSYVTDGDNNRVEIFNSSGGYIGQFGSVGNGAGQFSNPYGITIAPGGNIYVADAGNNRVQVFGSDKSYLGSIGTSGAGQLNAPQGIYIDASTNRLYVADSGNNRIAIFDLNNSGAYVTSLGGGGSSQGQFFGPSGLVVVGGIVYVTDAGNKRVVKLDASSGAGVGIIGDSGNGNGQFLSPAGITTDGTGKIYVTDKSTKSRVQIFNASNGSFLGVVGGTANSGNGDLNFPSGIAADKSGNIYVADRNNNRVEAFIAKEQYTANLVPVGNGPETVTISLSQAVTDANGDINATATYSVIYTATPASPANLTATSLDGSYQLNWSANSPVENVVGYNIYEGTSANNLTLLTSVDATATTYTSDIPINNGTTLYFYVTAVTSTKESAPSNIVSVTPKGNPIITAGTIPNKTYGDLPFDIQQILQPRSASAGAFTYSLDPSSVGVTLTSPSTINIVGVGHADVIITQAATNTYNAATLHVGFDINRATPQLNWNPVTTITYGAVLDASFFAATASKSGATSPALAGNIVYTLQPSGTVVSAATNTVLPIGDHDLRATYIPSSPDDANYTGNSKTVTIHVDKADPVIVWNNPADITYGTALSSVQLNASVTGVTGDLVYTPAIGTILGAGNNQQLKVTFTPTGADANNYSIVSKTVFINVTRIDPVIVWNNPADITYGTALSATQLNASVTGVTGDLVYTPAIGTILGVGNNQQLKVTFTPTGADAANYNVISKTVLINVTKADPLIVWNNPADIPYGTALSVTQLNASVTGVTGNMVYTPTIGTILGVGNNQQLKVTFTPTGADAANYNIVSKTVFINVTKADPVIVWNNPADITYGTALSSVQLNASVTGITGNLVYVPAVGTILGVGNNQQLKVTFTPTGADAVNYNIVSKTVFINVTKADPLIVWNNPADIPYGTALSTTQLNASVAGVTGDLVYTPGFNTILNGGNSQQLKVTFTPTGADAANYNIVSKTVQINVTKIDPVIVWNNPADIPYGTALSAIQLNASVTGVTGGLVYTPGLNAVLNGGANQQLKVTFTPTGADAANYNVVSKTVQINVTKIDPVIVWNNPADILYGTVLSATQLNASVTGVTGDLVYTPAIGTVLGTGANQQLKVTFTATGADAANYNTVSKTVSINVTKADPVIVWNNPADIPYGTALSTNQLNASVAGVTGDLVYTPGLNTVLSLGNGQQLKVAFTPTGVDAANYNVVSKTVLINVTKISPVITWNNPADIPYGTALSATQLNASVAGVTGDLVYTPAIGTILGVGNSQQLKVTFTPTGPNAANYNVVSKTVLINVIKANPVIVWNNPADITYGTALSAIQLNASVTGVTGNLVYAPSLNTVLNGGTTQQLKVTFTPTGADATKYNVVSKVVFINVLSATPIITWSNPANIIYGTTLSNVQYNASANVPGQFTYSILPAGTTEPLTVGTYTLQAVFHPSNTANYIDNITKNVSVTVDQATPIITWNPQPLTVGSALSIDQLNASTITTGGHFDYNPPLGTVMNTAGSQTLSTTFYPSDAVNYKSVTISKQVTVRTASIVTIDPQINWSTPAPINYGTVLSATQLNATATLPNTTTTIAGTFNYSLNAGSINDVLAVGTYQITATFIPTDLTHYNQVSKTVSITVNWVVPVITWAQPADVAVGTALTNAQLNAQTTINGTFVYTPAAGTVMNTVGIQQLSVVFHPADTHNYTDGITAHTTINVYAVDITKITPVINWNNPADITYGTLLSETQLNATATVPGTFVYSPVAGSAPLSVGNHTLSVTFTPTDLAHYNKATQTVTINVIPVSPVITWVTPTAITYGTALSATQLKATANVDGTFDYTPDFGTVLNVGANQTLSVRFTPNNNNYPVTDKTVVITVNKANPVISWANPAGIAQGVALSTAQLNATANTPGTFVYTPAIGTVLDAGANQTLSVTFTPADAANYNEVSKTVQINVDKLTPVLTWTNPTSITYGTALGDEQLYASATVPGTFAYTPAAGTILHAGNNQTLSVTFTPTDAINYNPVTKNVSINVNKAALNIATNDASRPYNQPNPDFVINYSGFVNGDTQASLATQATASSTATVTSLAGTYPITVSGAVSNDYTFRYINATLTITTIGRSLAFNQLPVKTYGDPDFDAGATATTGEPIIYTSSNTAVATIVNGRIHIVGAGYVTITASLPVNPGYNTTPSISQFMVVNKAAQTIDFATIPVQLRGTTYDLSNIKSSSGLPVTFTSNDPMIASINGLTVSSLRVGITGIVANQAGDANYYPANTAVRNIEVKDVNREVIVHPAVSPNGDGINDVLYIEGINEHPDNRVTIINRNGVRVYEINGYDNATKSFDGRSNFTGAKQQAGTYFYLVEYMVNGVGRHLTGYFVLKYE